MRCRDVSRAIAAPDGAITEAEIEAHLASCPRCAGQSEAALRLDRLWEATRPDSPPAARWEATWARIDREAASPGPAAPAPLLGVARRRVSIPIRLAAGLAATAAAAAVLLAPDPPGPGPATARADAIRRDFDVPVGHTVLLHVDSGEREVIQVHEPATDADLTFFDKAEAGMDAVDYFALFNWFEAMPELMASAQDDGRAPGNPFGPLAQ
ncbi:zf-HC2 domain-containing protein [Tautonia plasticadhaerens]|uniref:Zinc-finger domain-containing protein n=1 Tax=Tautonia plasticadhaerens TaxID=2527974 RepID=A0A518HDT8_9BACT|nr:zf-HC2 domain-containing protein [Tautonia plasticadhaerens]QDV39021.1 hypothetical protein ElP_69820 [Tautonia plasticadhaerens]